MERPNRYCVLLTVAAALSLLWAPGCQEPECMVDVTFTRGENLPIPTIVHSKYHEYDYLGGMDLSFTVVDLDGAELFADEGVTNRALVMGFGPDTHALSVSAWANDENGVSIGYGDTAVACEPGTVETSLTMVLWFCGDGSVNGYDVCDGTSLDGNDCTTLGMGYEGGLLDCLSDCSDFDTSGCTVPADCGDGVLDPGEQCDGAELNGADCSTEGFAGGTLACWPGCTYDVTGCF